MRQGRLLPGNKIVPERIRENREPYYAVLKAADRAWNEGHFDVSGLAAYLGDLLLAQLTKKAVSDSSVVDALIA